LKPLPIIPSGILTGPLSVIVPVPLGFKTKLPPGAFDVIVPVLNAICPKLLVNVGCPFAPITRVYPVSVVGVAPKAA
jgi:hypothetical protein